MRLCTVRLARLPIRNAIAQRASPFSMIRERPDPVPPDQINTSPDLILPVSLHLLRGKSAQVGISLSLMTLNLTTHSPPPPPHSFSHSIFTICQCRVGFILYFTYMVDHMTIL